MGSFDKKPQEVPKDPVLFVWLEMFSSLTISCHIFLGVNTLKGTANASAVDLLTPNTLRGTKTALLTPKRYYEHPCPFYWGVSPGWTHRKQTIIGAAFAYYRELAKF